MIYWNFLCFLRDRVSVIFFLELTKPKSSKVKTYLALRPTRARDLSSDVTCRDAVKFWSVEVIGSSQFAVTKRVSKQTNKG